MAVDSFELRRGERRRALRVTADGVEMLDERLQLLVDVVGGPLDPPGQPAGRDEECHLNDRHGEGRHGNHAQEDDAPVGHACSRARAC